MKCAQKVHIFLKAQHFEMIQNERRGKTLSPLSLLYPSGKVCGKVTTNKENRLHRGKKGRERAARLAGFLSSGSGSSADVIISYYGNYSHSRLFVKSFAKLLDPCKILTHSFLPI